MPVQIMETARMVSLSYRPTAETLWELNQLYSQRLNRARSQLDLLIRLLETRRLSLETLESLRWARTQLEKLYIEHRDWRYRYFYGSQDVPRMVRDDSAVQVALSHLHRLSERSHQQLHTIASVFNAIERPASPDTALAQGDLWELLIGALNDLATPLDD